MGIQAIGYVWAECGCCPSVPIVSSLGYVCRRSDMLRRTMYTTGIRNIPH
jgi:hypothetical protein